MIQTVTMKIANNTSKVILYMKSVTPSLRIFRCRHCQHELGKTPAQERNDSGRRRSICVRMFLTRFAQHSFAKFSVTRRNGSLDPQGKSISTATKSPQSRHTAETHEARYAISLRQEIAK
jgi:hypothetical protein